MKAKSKEIKNLLENEPFLNLKILQEKVLEFNFPTEHNEYTINEAIVDLENLRDILIKSIDENILDTHGFQSRVTLLDFLQKLKNHINNTINGQNILPTLLDETQRTKEYILRTLNLDMNSNLLDYETKIVELNNLQQKYNSLLVELDRATGIYEKTKEQIQTINDNNLISQDLIDQHTNIDAQIQEQSIVITDITSQIQSQFNQVDGQSATINDFSATINAQEEKFAKAEEATNILINKNKELESKVIELLSLAVGGALGKTFGERKSELNRSESFWKKATFIAIIFLFSAAGLVYYELSTGIDETTVVMSKIALLIPASAAIWFTASNHNRERKLLEEYAFKSSISLSLDSYRKVLNEELSDGERDKIPEFLINSMEKIYSSPLENISKHPSSDNIEVSLLEKIAKLFR
jgi:hypothetical protein